MFWLKNIGCINPSDNYAIMGLNQSAGPGLIQKKYDLLKKETPTPDV